MCASQDSGVALGGLVLIYFACSCLSIYLTSQFVHSRYDYWEALRLSSSFSKSSSALHNDGHLTDDSHDHRDSSGGKAHASDDDFGGGGGGVANAKRMSKGKGNGSSRRQVAPTSPAMVGDAARSAIPSSNGGKDALSAGVYGGPLGSKPMSWNMRRQLSPRDFVMRPSSSLSGVDVVSAGGSAAAAGGIELQRGLLTPSPALAASSNGSPSNEQPQEHVVHMPAVPEQSFSNVSSLVSFSQVPTLSAVSGTEYVTDSMPPVLQQMQLSGSSMTDVPVSNGQQDQAFTTAATSEIQDVDYDDYHQRSVSPAARASMSPVYAAEAAVLADADNDGAAGSVATTSPPLTTAPSSIGSSVWLTIEGLEHGQTHSGMAPIAVPTIPAALPGVVMMPSRPGLPWRSLQQLQQLQQSEQQSHATTSKDAHMEPLAVKEVAEASTATAAVTATGALIRGGWGAGALLPTTKSQPLPSLPQSSSLQVVSHGLPVAVGGRPGELQQGLLEGVAGPSGAASRGSNPLVSPTASVMSVRTPLSSTADDVQEWADLGTADVETGRQAPGTAGVTRWYASSYASTCDSSGESAPTTPGVGIPTISEIGYNSDSAGWDVNRSVYDRAKHVRRTAMKKVRQQ